MRFLYTIHQTTPSIIYRGVVENTAVASRVLKALGMKVPQSMVSLLANGKKWSNKVIIVRHEVKDSDFIDTHLLVMMQLKGTSEASRLLNERKRNTCQPKEEQEETRNNAETEI